MSILFTKRFITALILSTFFIPILLIAAFPTASDPLVALSIGLPFHTLAAVEVLQIHLRRIQKDHAYEHIAHRQVLAEC